MNRFQTRVPPTAFRAPTTGALQGAVTGIQWSITDWLERGKNLNTDAVRLGSLQAALPATDPARIAFQGWWAAWQPFYEKYIGPSATSLAQSNVSVNYDDFNRDLILRKSQFDNIAAQYNKEPTTPEKYVPSSDGGGGSDDAGVPWWAALVGGVAVGGLGYWLFKKFSKPAPRVAPRRHT